MDEDGVQQIVDVARSLAVLVRTSGPDPRGRKMHGHVFYHADSGKTTLSSSGFLVPESFSDHSTLVERLTGHGGKNPTVAALVVTAASVVEPFVSSVQQDRGIQSQGPPRLVPGSRIDVLIEARKPPDKSGGEEHEDPSWLPAELLALVDVPTSSTALTSLIKGHGGSWEVGWSLLPSTNVPYSNIHSLQVEDRDSAKRYLQEIQSTIGSNNLKEPSFLATAATRLAFLILPAMGTKDRPHVNISLRNKEGDVLLAMGSPFGILSPLHFFNSVSVGVIANCCPSVASCSSLLMADIRCLPGLVVPWDAIVDGVNKNFQKAFASAQLDSSGNTVSNSRLRADSTSDSIQSSEYAFATIPPSFQLQKAMTSVVLVTVGDGAWASGVILNSEGLILTNAHLLEPWRFREVSRVSGNANKLWTSPVLSQKHKGPSDTCKWNLMPEPVSMDDFGDDGLRNPTYQGYGRIRVRLNHVNTKVWCDARAVYVSRGPLDIALLQIESVPNCIFPVTPEIASPKPGSKAFVIGHGLLDLDQVSTSLNLQFAVAVKHACSSSAWIFFYLSRSLLYMFHTVPDLCASVTSGVIARVVSTPHKAIDIGHGKPIPVMLETTAAVHPGGSGGGVFNSKGHLIGLVTRHAGYVNITDPRRANEIAAIWSLVPPPDAMPSLPESILDKKDGEKGSRFATFIKEHHAEKLLQRSSDRQGQTHNAEKLLQRPSDSQGQTHSAYNSRHSKL